jgi:hypothetical protein
MTLILVHLHLLLMPDDGTSSSSRPTAGHRDSGQATTEYALVMLGAAVIALLVITWATAGGGAGKIGGLFDRVIDAVIGKI